MTSASASGTTANSTAIRFTTLFRSGGSEEIFNKYAGSNGSLDQKEFHSANLQRKDGSQSPPPSAPPKPEDTPLPSPPDPTADDESKRLNTNNANSVSREEWKKAGRSDGEFDMYAGAGQQQMCQCKFDR